MLQDIPASPQEGATAPGKSIHISDIIIPWCLSIRFWRLVCRCSNNPCQSLFIQECIGMCMLTWTSSACLWWLQQAFGTHHACMCLILVACCTLLQHVSQRQFCSVEEVHAWHICALHICEHEIQGVRWPSTCSSPQNQHASVAYFISWLKRFLRTSSSPRYLIL